MLMIVINPSEKLMIMLNWLVVEPYPSEKYEVSWGYHSQAMEK